MALSPIGSIRVDSSERLLPRMHIRYKALQHVPRALFRYEQVRHRLDLAVHPVTRQCVQHIVCLRFGYTGALHGLSHQRFRLFDGRDLNRLLVTLAAVEKHR
jgi:hypothetical protein